MKPTIYEDGVNAYDSDDIVKLLKEITELKTENLQLKLYIEQLKEDRCQAIAQAKSS